MNHYHYQKRDSVIKSDDITVNPDLKNMTILKHLILLLIITSIFSISGYSQTNNCDCKTELQFLDGKIKKTPAYKLNKNSYNEEIARLATIAEKTTTIYDCYVILNKLMLSLNDNHSRVYGLDKGAVEEVKNDSIKYSLFKTSEIYNAYPIPKMDIDSLTTVLSSKLTADVEGIYSIKDFLTIGFFEDKTHNEYKAIVLDSEIDIWRRGEIIYTSIPYGKNYFLNMGGNLSTKRLVTFTERIENGLFYTAGFKKEMETINYATKLPTDNTYYRDEISPDITYLRIGSFSGWNPTLGEAERFYKQLEGTLIKPKLILDLRNNGGGGDRNSDILFKILKSYAKKNNMYVLINHLTVSNAEQFAYKLSEISNCEIFGQQSNGTAAYEVVNGSFELPGGHFNAYLTSKTHSKYLEIESNGVSPNIKLDLNSDWIEQTIKLIEEKN
jgi:hypothetical protein